MIARALATVGAELADVRRRLKWAAEFPDLVDERKLSMLEAHRVELEAEWLAAYLDEHDEA